MPICSAENFSILSLHLCSFSNGLCPSPDKNIVPLSLFLKIDPQLLQYGLLLKV